MGAILAAWLTHYACDVQDLPGAFATPSLAHGLGTDGFGRGLLTRLLYGARTSLSVSAIAIGPSVGAGMVLGASAGGSTGR